MKDKRLNSQKCIYYVLCDSPKKKEAYHDVFVNVSSGLFTGVYVSCTATGGRVAWLLEKRNALMHLLSVFFAINVAWKRTVKSGNID